MTDFPYGNDTAYDDWDDSAYNLDKLIEELMPILLTRAPVALITCGVANIKRFPRSDWILSWITKAGAGSGPWGFCCWQPILAYGKDPWLVNGKGRQPDIHESTEIAEKNGHPCPKPIAFWKWLLKRGSVEKSDIIIDPLCGSGTSLLAAKELGNPAIGIDLSKRYLDITINRLRQEMLPLAPPEIANEQEILF